MQNKRVQLEKEWKVYLFLPLTFKLKSEANFLAAKVETWNNNEKLIGFCR